MMSATTTKEPKRKPMVYIVDDDDGMRRALSVLMTTVGYQPAAFAGPREFIAKHDPSQPSCLVLDVRMPEMSGLELQQHLNRSGSMLPVILISGHGDIPMAVQAMMRICFSKMGSLARRSSGCRGGNAACGACRRSSASAMPPQVGRC